MLYFISYYCYVLELDLIFRFDGSLIFGLVVRFIDFLQKFILIMGVNFSESWLVELVKVFYDFDNLLLEEVGRMKEISYFLEDFCLFVCVLEGLFSIRIFLICFYKRSKKYIFFLIYFLFSNWRIFFIVKNYRIFIYCVILRIQFKKFIQFYYLIKFVIY